MIAASSQGRPPEGAPAQENAQAHPAEAAQERQRWRFWIVALAFGLFSLIILLRLTTQQLFQWGQELPTGKAHQGAVARGSIVDRNGMLLAADHFYYQVAATAREIKTEDDRREVAEQLESLIGLPANRTLSLLTTYADAYFVELAKTAPLEQGEKILALQARLAEEREVFPLQYVFITPAPQRYYPQEQLASHLIGFVNRERQGFYGLESYYDTWLAADQAVAYTLKPQKSLESLSPLALRYLPSPANKDLVLTIDSAIQWIVEDELRRGLEKFKAEGGTIIVIEPKSGAILGMASLPDYDPNRYADAKFEQFLDPALSEQYEPGSVFKIVTFAAGLDTGVITPTRIMTDPGSITVGGRIIFNSQRVGYGRITAVDAFARSLNVVTAEVAQQVGALDFYDYVRRFGFGAPTEVDLAGEVPGSLKMPGNENWSLSDLGTNSFGQGLAVTPLQMINAVASIANGGVLMRPYVVQARLHDGMVLETEPTVIHTTMKPDKAREMAAMMVDVVEIGNQAAIIEGYKVAGKSGTAQIPEGGRYLEDAVNASFVGFAPADDPAFAIIVMLKRPDPKISQWASYNAAPIFAQVMTRLLEYANIPPDDIRLGRQMTTQLISVKP
jgi:cell division protein FtsI/penicillin-binding protein 2